MIERGNPGYFRVLVKAVLFTLVVPGTVVALVPVLLLPDASLGAIDPYGLTMLGVLPLALGIALYFRCAFRFVRFGGGTPAPIDPPVRLVIVGPYRYSRNPMYLGILAILAGEVILYRDLRLLLYLVALAIGFHLFIVLYEERTLRRRFGSGYAHYRLTVPRWIPGWSNLETLYRRSFLQIGSLVLTAGAVAHALRLSVGLPVVETPDSVHALLVVLPAYSVLGCIVYARRIDLPGYPRKILFALIAGLLLVTLIMHLYSIVAHDNAWLGLFPMWYSVVALVAYAGCAHFFNTRTVQDRIALSC